MDTLYMINHTNGVMVSVLASSAVDRGFKQTKDYAIGIFTSPLSTQQ